MAQPSTRSLRRTIRKSEPVPSRPRTPSPSITEGFFAPNGQAYIGEPRVLLLDIEVASSVGHVWGKYEQDVIEFESHFFILCFSYKWLHEKKTHVVALPHFKGYKNDLQNDKQLLLKLHSLLSEADCVVGHNFSRFDHRKINTRFVVHGIEPPKPYAIIDTLKLVRRHFAFESNRLNDLCQQLGLGRKQKTHGSDTWLGAMRGDMKEWKNMIRYSAQDTVLEDKLLHFIIAWAGIGSNRRRPIIAKGYA